MLPSMAHDSFEREMDRLLDDARSSAWAPACNLYEDDSTYSIAVALPGCHPDRIQAQVHDGMLTIKGERKVESPEGRIWYLRHIPEGPFACSVKLPGFVDDQTSTASFQHGVLTITFAKCEEGKSRRIMIKGS